MLHNPHQRSHPVRRPPVREIDFPICTFPHSTFSSTHRNAAISLCGRIVRATRPPPRSPPHSRRAPCVTIAILSQLGRLTFPPPCPIFITTLLKFNDHLRKRAVSIFGGPESSDCLAKQQTSPPGNLTYSTVTRASPTRVYCFNFGHIITLWSNVFNWPRYH